MVAHDCEQCVSKIHKSGGYLFAINANNLKMKSNFVNRWDNNSDAHSALEKSSFGNAQSLSDFRGIPFGSKTERKTLKQIQFSYADFSYATFEESNFIDVKFSNCVFTGVNFVELRTWNSVFDKCVFEFCDFSNATLGVNVAFTDCEFTKVKLKGKYFNFGRFCSFERCNFMKCDIRSAWVLSTTFENCTFQSKFTNVRFSGSQEVSIENKSENGHYPATFRQCNLHQSEFCSVEFMDGVVFEDSTLPNQAFERNTGDRNYYPALTK